MLTSPDFKELLNLFEKHEIRYLIVGGYAVMKYSEPLRFEQLLANDPCRLLLYKRLDWQKSV